MKNPLEPNHQMALSKFKFQKFGFKFVCKLVTWKRIKVYFVYNKITYSYPESINDLVGDLELEVFF